MRAKVREDLGARKQREADHAARQAVLDQVLLENPIVLPDVLVEREIRYRLEDMIRSMIVQGLDPEKMELDWADLRKRQEAGARKAVHAQMILDTVARTENIAVDDEAIEERIQSDAKRLGESPAKLRAGLVKQHGLEALKTQMVREKSLDYLTSIANIQYLE